MSDPGSGGQLREVVDRLQREATELHRSRKRLVEAADADRRAIERALHDGVQQHLVALAVDLRRLAGLVDDHPAAARALLDDLVANLREAMHELTDLAQKIYPPLFEGRGLASALRSAAESAGVTPLVDVPAGADYPPEIGATVYWSYVEALGSASPGSQAAVTVREANGALTFEVAVAGHNPDERLDRLRDRIEALGGSFSVDVVDLWSRVHGSLPVSR